MDSAYNKRDSSSSSPVSLSSSVANVGLLQIENRKKRYNTGKKCFGLMFVSFVMVLTGMKQFRVKFQKARLTHKYKKATEMLIFMLIVAFI